MKTIVKPLLVLLFAVLSACEKYVDIPPAPQLLQTEEVFRSEQGVTAAVNGIYGNLRATSVSFLNGGMSLYAGLSVGEIYNTTTNATYDPFSKNLITTANTTVTTMFWAAPFNTIYRCNLIIEGIANSKTLTQQFKDQIKGEMLVVRSLAYFYMVNLYGDVPLVLTTDYNLNARMGRTSIEEIYRQLINDLKLAQGLLKPNYPSVGKTRPNRHSANALLARVYLYKEEYQNAMEVADQILTANVYNLTNDLTKTFLVNSTETIWEIAAPSENKNTAEATLFVPSTATAKPTFAIPELYMNVFDNLDKRKSIWIAKNINAGTTFHYPAKFKNRLTTPVTEYDVVFRLSEIYLIKAESAARLEDKTSAVNALNTVRRRAGISDLSKDLSTPLLLEAVLQERQREFLGEWGHRWFDLKRLSMIEQVMAIEKPGFKSFAQWFPIPQTQIIINHNLNQNEGYQ